MLAGLQDSGHDRDLMALVLELAMALALKFEISDQIKARGKFSKKLSEKGKNTG
jgi:hypothetical protein